MISIIYHDLVYYKYLQAAILLNSFSKKGGRFKRIPHRDLQENKKNLFSYLDLGILLCLIQE